MRPQARAEALKKQVGHLWHEVVGQFDDLKRQLTAQTSSAAKRVLNELEQLKKERDRLITRLGEETLTVVNSSNERVPSVLKPTAERINKVVAQLVAKQTKARQEAAVDAPKESARAVSPGVAAKKTSVKKPRAAAKKSDTTRTKPAASKIASNKQPVARKTNPDTSH